MQMSGIRSAFSTMCRQVFSGFLVQESSEGLTQWRQSSDGR